MKHITDFIIEKFKITSQIKYHYPFENKIDMDKVTKVFTNNEIKKILDTCSELDKDPDEVYNVEEKNIVFKYYHDKSHTKYNSIGIYKHNKKFAVVFITKSKNIWVYPLGCHIDTGEDMFTNLDDCLNCLIEQQNKVIKEL